MHLKTRLNSYVQEDLPSGSPIVRWCCYEPADKTRSVPAHHAGPTAHLPSLPHGPHLSQSPYSQHLLLQVPATPTGKGTTIFKKLEGTGDVKINYCPYYML